MTSESDLMASPPPVRRAIPRFLSTHGLTLLAGMPALGAGILVAWFGASHALAPHHLIVASYQRQADANFAAGRWAVAEVCVERLIREEGPRDNLRYRLSSVLEARGNKARAAAIVQELAPVNRAGYAPAQLQRAKILLSAGNRSSDRLREAEIHLKLAMNSRSEAVEARSRLGELCLAAGRRAEAEALFEAAAAERPSLYLTLARLAHARGDEAAASRRANEARRAFRVETEAHPGDPEPYLGLANAAVFLNDFPTAVSTLEKGMAATRGAAFAPALAKVYASWSSAPEEIGGDLARRLSLIERGLVYDPSSPPLLDRLAGLLRVQGKEAEQSRAALTRLLASGRSAASAHFLLGVDAAAQGHDAEARLHWEEASRLSPNTPAIANNLAWSLAHADPPDLPRALELMELALGVRPGDLRFRDTRARVLFKMNRWREALPDLEAVLAASPRDADVHRLLSETYDRLGSPGLADEHRRQFKELSGAGK